ncbi:MAG: hypothetical protein AAGF12_33865, partial [Myxococcota bacterium]
MDQLPGKHFLDRLLRDGVIDAEAHRQSLLHARRIGEHCEDALVDTGGMTEADLLKYKANTYRTRFVSTQKLAKASVDRSLLRMVPKRVADRILACPIMFDRAKQHLSVVAGDFEAHDVVKQVQLVSGVRTVTAYVARPAAVTALIRKHYQGDMAAFAMLLSGIGAPADAQMSGGVAYYDPDNRKDAIPLDLGPDPG